MTSIADICIAISDLVKAIGEAIWEFDNNPGLLEEARKLHQLLRRIEVLISDIEPYLKGVRVWSSLREVEGTLSALLQILSDTGVKGPLVQYLRADRIVAGFSVAAARLEVSLARLQDEACVDFGTNGAALEVPSSQTGGKERGASRGTSGRPAVPTETREELSCVRGLLQRTRFELPAAHWSNLQRFRQACDSLQTEFQALMDSYNEMMDHTMQERLLSKECFNAAIVQLKQEVALQQEVMQGIQPSRAPGGQRGQGHPQLGLAQAQRCEAEQHYLRVLMDVVRACHVDTDSEAPLDYLCPLTHQLMQDPVLLHETGHSYERKALEEWWAKGHHFCPRTGVHLRRLNTSPNHNLRNAIQRWQLHSDMQLSFRPMLNTLAEQQRQQSLQATPCRQLEERLLRMVERERELAREQEQEPAVQKSPESQNLEGIPAGLGDCRQVPEACCAARASAAQSQAGVCRASTAPIAVERGEKLAPLLQCSPVGVDAERALSLSANDFSEIGNSEATGRCSPCIYTPQRSTSQELEVAGFGGCYVRGKDAAEAAGPGVAPPSWLGEAAGAARDAAVPGSICRISEPAVHEGQRSVRNGAFSGEDVTAQGTSNGTCGEGGPWGRSCAASSELPKVTESPDRSGVAA